MRPYQFRIVDTITTFHYTYKELKAFLKHGFAEGNNGWILVKREGEFDTFRGFGTIENPNRSLITISMQHDDLFDGPRSTPSEIVNPPKREPVMEHYRWDFLDMNSINKQ